MATVGKAESPTKVVTLAAFSFQMVMHAGEEAETVMIFLPHTLKKLKFFTKG